MAVNILVNGKIIKQMEREFFIMLTPIFIKVIGLMIKLMVMGLILMKMGPNILAIGETISRMVMGSKSGKTDNVMRDNTWTEAKLEKVS
jgi:hypothetical protein